MISRGCALFVRLCPIATAAGGTPYLAHCGSAVFRSRPLSSLPAEAALAVGAKAAASSVDKNALSRLRKKTGYSFINCRKALEQFAGDEVQAESWLREQAVKEGWSKALKLQSRPMSQGLIGVMTNDRIGVMVEVNCETDFVAKNAKFQQLVATVASACWQSASQRLASGDGAYEVAFSGEEIMQLKVDGGQTLKDSIVSQISNIGENMAARRAVAIAAVNKTDLVGRYVHLAGASIEEPVTQSGISIGKYAALVLVRPVSAVRGTVPAVSQDEVHNVATQIGQHVVGMRPLVLEDSSGVAHEPSSSPGGSGGATTAQPAVAPAVGDSAAKASSEVESRALLNQEFLMDAAVTVKEWLRDKHVDVVSFARFEVGEDLAASMPGKDACAATAVAAA